VSATATLPNGLLRVVEFQVPATQAKGRCYFLMDHSLPIHVGPGDRCYRKRWCDRIIDATVTSPEADYGMRFLLERHQLLLMPVTLVQRHIVALDINGACCTNGGSISAKNTDALPVVRMRKIIIIPR